MRKIVILLLAMGALLTLANADMKCQAGKCGAKMDETFASQPKTMTKMFQTVSEKEATILQQGDAKMFCPECGMSLPMYYKTNHAATVNGKVKQYCSLHCVVGDTKRGSSLSDIKVADVTSLKFIDANKAYYVVGSSKAGTMSMVSQYAFASKVNAEAFAKENGGKVTDYQGAYKAAEADFEKDTQMVDQKQDMAAQQGEKVYGEMCQKTDQKFTTTVEAKTFILANKLCKALDEKQLHAVGLYLKSR